MVIGYVCLILYIFSPVQEQDSPSQFQEMISPSGKFVLKQVPVIDAYDVPGYSFVVWQKDEKEESSYEADEYFRKRDRFVLCWAEDTDTIWVYSGDVGTFCWVFEEQTWKKYSFGEYQKKGLKPPSNLKQ